MMSSIAMPSITVSTQRALPQLDLTGEADDTPVTIEIDHKRKVMYIHVEGQTVLRICRAEFVIEENNK